MKISQTRMSELLACLHQGRLPEGGMAFAQEWAGLDLDYSPESISRINALLKHIFQSNAATPVRLRATFEGQNFLLTLAAYLADYVARHTGAEVVWRDSGVAAYGKFAFEPLRMIGVVMEGIGKEISLETPIWQVFRAAPDADRNLMGDFLLERHRRNLPIPQGFAYEARLQTVPFDYSASSLRQIDSLLTAIRNQEALDETAARVLFYDPNHRNLLLLFAFYTGKTVAALCGVPLRCLNAIEDAQARGVAVSEDFYDSVMLELGGLRVPILRVLEQLLGSGSGGCYTVLSDVEEHCGVQANAVPAAVPASAPQATVAILPTSGFAGAPVPPHAPIPTPIAANAPRPPVPASSVPAAPQAQPNHSVQGASALAPFAAVPNSVDDPDTLARRLVDGFLRGNTPPDGAPMPPIALEKLLSALKPDYSLESLERLDRLLAQLSTRAPEPAAFTAQEAGMNFLHFCALYIARSAAWQSRNFLTLSDYAATCCRLPDLPQEMFSLYAAQIGPRLYFPLGRIIAQIWHPERGQSSAAFARELCESASGSLSRHAPAAAGQQPTALPVMHKSGMAACAALWEKARAPQQAVTALFLAPQADGQLSAQRLPETAHAAAAQLLERNPHGLPFQALIDEANIPLPLGRCAAIRLRIRLYQNPHPAAWEGYLPYIANAEGAAVGNLFLNAPIGAGAAADLVAAAIYAGMDSFQAGAGGIAPGAWRQLYREAW